MLRKLLVILLLFPITLPSIANAQLVDSKTKTVSLADGDLLPRAVFGVLLAEIALSRGKPGVALAAYVDLAQRSNDLMILSRAFEIAADNRQYDLSLQLAKQWVQTTPRSFAAQQAVIAALLQLNRLDELAVHIAVMLEIDKESLPEHLIYLNRMLTRQPDRAAVSKLVQKVASPYAGIAEAHYAIAVAAFYAEELERASAESQKALELRPDWELAALVYARILAKTSAPEAITFLDRFVNDNSKAADARLLLARLLLGEKKYDLARQHFAHLLDDHPESAEVLYPAAMLALQQEDRPVARMLLVKLLASNFPDKSTAYYYLAMLDEHDEQYDIALSNYGNVIAGEYYLAARGRAAQVMAKQGRFDEALALLRQTNSKTKEERLRIGLAEAGLLREAKRDAESFVVLEKLAKESPEDVELLYESALVAERLGKYDIFETRIKRILELKPEDAYAMNALGYSFADRNTRLDESYALLKKASDLKPEDPFIMDSLGWLLFRQGKHDEGLKLLQSAYSIRPDGEIAAHIGEALWTMGRREEALVFLRAATEKYPKNETLAALIKKFQP